MKHFAFGERKSMRSRFGCVALCASALGGVLIVSSLGVAAQEKDKSGVNVTVTGKDGSDVAGLMISAKATAKEVGLPLYPGARPSKEDGDGSAAANLGLWGSSFGFKLVVLKMESNDSKEKWLRFIKRPLQSMGRS